MEILDLDKVPHMAPEVARWQWTTWPECFQPSTAAQALADLHRMPGHRLPRAWVALEAGRLAGTVSLLEEDGLDVPGAPWLASFVVRKDLRGQGVGRLLLDRLVRESDGMGYPHLYAWTRTIGPWLSRLGWERLPDSIHDHRPVEVYRRPAVPIPGAPVLWSL